jgi:hypothetical protein
MSDRRYRVLAVATHLVQYMTPIFRRMAEHPSLDFQVAYCSMRGAEASHDPEFGANIQWDVPVLDGTAQRAALGIALGIGLLFFVFPEALLSRVAFYTETLTPGVKTSELQNRTWNYPLQNFLGAFGYERWPYGYGIGTTSLGTQYVARIFGARPLGIGVESGYGTLVVEMGIGGLLLWFTMSFAILFSAWRVVKSLRGSPWFPLAFMIFWYAGLLLFPITFSGMQAYQDFVLNAYFWLLLGVLFRLPTLPISSQYAAAAQIPPVYDPRIRMR